MPKVDWGKYGYGQGEKRPAAGPPAQPPFLPPSPGERPLIQLGPTPGRPVNLPIAFGQLARQALEPMVQGSTDQPGSELAELEFLATEERVSVRGWACTSCGFLCGPPPPEQCRRCQANGLRQIEAVLPLTMFDLLISSGLAHSPGKAALLLRHRIVEIDGTVVADAPVPLRHGSIVATGEGLLARVVNTDLTG